jgi:hypothetical protein
LTVAHDGHVFSLNFTGGSCSVDAFGVSGPATPSVAPHAEQNLLVAGTLASQFAQTTLGTGGGSGATGATAVVRG